MHPCADIYRFISPSQWEYYSSLFDNVWGASAFKGAFGETLTVPDMKMHLDNNIAWLLALQEQDKKFQNIQGLVITGWQRYDHLGNLCELLAVKFLDSLCRITIYICRHLYLHSCWICSLSRMDDTTSLCTNDSINL